MQAVVTMLMALQTLEVLGNQQENKTKETEPNRKSKLTSEEIFNDPKLIKAMYAHRRRVNAVDDIKIMSRPPKIERPVNVTLSSYEIYKDDCILFPDGKMNLDNKAGILEALDKLKSKTKVDDYDYTMNRIKRHITERNFGNKRITHPTLRRNTKITTDISDSQPEPPFNPLHALDSFPSEAKNAPNHPDDIKRWMEEVWPIRKENIKVNDTIIHNNALKELNEDIRQNKSTKPYGKYYKRAYREEYCFNAMANFKAFQRNTTESPELTTLPWKKIKKQIKRTLGSMADSARDSTSSIEFPDNVMNIIKDRFPDYAKTADKSIDASDFIRGEVRDGRRKRRNVCNNHTNNTNHEKESVLNGRFSDLFQQFKESHNIYNGPFEGKLRQDVDEIKQIKALGRYITGIALPLTKFQTKSTLSTILDMENDIRQIEEEELENLVYDNITDMASPVDKFQTKSNLSTIIDAEKGIFHVEEEELESFIYNNKTQLLEKEDIAKIKDDLNNMELRRDEQFSPQLRDAISKLILKNNMTDVVTISTSQVTYKPWESLTRRNLDYLTPGDVFITNSHLFADKSLQIKKDMNWKHEDFKEMGVEEGELENLVGLDLTSSELRQFHEQNGKPAPTTTPSVKIEEITALNLITAKITESIKNRRLTSRLYTISSTQTEKTSTKEKEVTKGKNSKQSSSSKKIEGSTGDFLNKRDFQSLIYKGRTLNSNTKRPIYQFFKQISNSLEQLLRDKAKQIKVKRPENMSTTEKVKEAMSNKIVNNNSFEEFLRKKLEQDVKVKQVETALTTRQTDYLVGVYKTTKTFLNIGSYEKFMEKADKEVEEMNVSENEPLEQLDHANLERREKDTENMKAQTLRAGVIWQFEKGFESVHARRHAHKNDLSAYIKTTHDNSFIGEKIMGIRRTAPYKSKMRAKFYDYRTTNNKDDLGSFDFLVTEPKNQITNEIGTKKMQTEESEFSSCSSKEESKHETDSNLDRNLDNYIRKLAAESKERKAKQRINKVKGVLNRTRRDSCKINFKNLKEETRKCRKIRGIYSEEWKEWKNIENETSSMLASAMEKKAQYPRPKWVKEMDKRDEWFYRADNPNGFKMIDDDGTKDILEIVKNKTKFSESSDDINEGDKVAFDKFKACEDYAARSLPSQLKPDGGKSDENLDKSEFNRWIHETNTSSKEPTMNMYNEEFDIDDGSRRYKKRMAAFENMLRQRTAYAKSVVHTSSEEREFLRNQTNEIHPKTEQINEMRVSSKRINSTEKIISKKTTEIPNALDVTNFKKTERRSTRANWITCDSSGIIEGNKEDFEEFLNLDVENAKHVTEIKKEDLEKRLGKKLDNLNMSKIKLFH